MEVTSDAELSRELALALGWDRVEIAASGEECLVKQVTDHGWRWLDYRDPTVVVPLIKWLMLKGVNVWNPDGIPTAWEWSAPDGAWGKADTLEAAVARAVIAVRKGE